MKKFLFPAALILLALISFTATALAQTAAAGDGGSILELLGPVVDAITSGEYVYASALALVLAVAVARRYGSNVWPFLGTGPGASLLVLLGSFGAALVAALPGAGISWALAKTALLVAVSAAGGYSLLRSLVLKPLLKKWGDKLPLWLRIPVAFLVNERSRVEKAEAAGVAAVAAKPGAGASSVIGESDEIA